MKPLFAILKKFGQWLYKKEQNQNCGFIQGLFTLPFIVYMWTLKQHYNRQNTNEM